MRVMRERNAFWALLQCVFSEFAIIIKGIAINVERVCNACNAFSNSKKIS
jgi:hypothetical protein